MNNISNIIKYICFFYPYPQDLSNARLTKLIYLTDWESVRKSGHQVTNIKWYFDNYGPFVHDVSEIANTDPEIEIIYTQTIYGTPKVMFRYLGQEPSLEIYLKNIINLVIEKTKSMYWNEFIDYVYSTPPVLNSDRYTFLKLENFNAY